MALFKDLIKKWFYTTSSSAASSDARVALLTASGDPKGSDTMANLASVLGAAKGDVTNNTSADDYTSPGVWSFNFDRSKLTDIPEVAKHGLLVVYKAGSANGGNPIVQVIYDYENKNNFKRLKWVNTWTSWQQIYDTSILTNSSLLSPLASALGGAQWIYNTSLNVAPGETGNINLPTTVAFVAAVPRGWSFIVTILCVESESVTLIREGSRSEGWSASRTGTGSSAHSILSYTNAQTTDVGWKIFYVAFPN